MSKQPSNTHLSLTRWLCAAAVSAWLAIPAQGAIIFQDDFNSITGATREILNSPSMNNIQSADPMSSESGSYINSSPSSGGSQSVVRYTPTSAATSWEALASSTTVSTVKYTTLNGGFDLFIRPNATETASSRMGVYWLRPVDVDSASGQGFRMILEGNGAGSLVLQLISKNGNAIRTADTGAFNRGSIGASLPNFYERLTLGEEYHLGFTFSTDVNGKITMSTYGVAGTGEILTTAGSPHLLASTSFYISDDVARAVDGVTGVADTIFGGGAAWTVSTRSDAGTFSPGSTNIDYDMLRMYTGAVTSFAALPVPEPGLPLLLTCGLVAIGFRRRRR